MKRETPKQIKDLLRILSAEKRARRLRIWAKQRVLARRSVLIEIDKEFLMGL